MATKKKPPKTRPRRKPRKKATQKKAVVPPEHRYPEPAEVAGRLLLAMLIGVAGVVVGTIALIVAWLV